MCDGGGLLDEIDEAWSAAERASRGATTPRGLADALEVELRRGLEYASVVSAKAQVPPALAGHLIEQGIWSPRVAVDALRLPSGGYRPDAVASLAPWLDAAHLRAVLAACASDDAPTHDMEHGEAIGVGFARLGELEGAGAVLEVLAGYPKGARALVAAASFRSLPRACWSQLARWVADDAVASVDHPSHAAAAAFAALPMLPIEPAAGASSQRARLIRAALDRLVGEDFGLDPEHAALLGAAGEWSVGWDHALGETMPYARGRMLAHVAPWMPEGALRDEAYARWFDAYRDAATGSWGFSLVSLEVPRALPRSLAGPLLAFVRARQGEGDRVGAARALVGIAHALPDVRDEARDAVLAIDDAADGAHACLALAPAYGGDAAGEAAALAARAYALALGLIDARRGDELRERHQYWPRGPGATRWTYIPPFRDPTAVLVEAIGWLDPGARAARVRELYGRHAAIDDAAMVCAAVAAIVRRHVPDAGARAPWFDALVERARDDEDDPVLLAELAALEPDDARAAALASRAWRHGRARHDTPEAAGRALAAASARLPEGDRAAAQVEALPRWRAARHSASWTEFLEACRNALAPEAVAWAMRAGADGGDGRADARAAGAGLGESEFVARALLPAIRDRAWRRRVATHWYEASARRFFWQEFYLLHAFAPDASVDAASALLDEVERVRERGFPAMGDPYVQLGAAAAVLPLCAAGENARADALRAELVHPAARCVGALAAARHEDDRGAREALLAQAGAALADLPDDADGGLEDVAIDALARDVAARGASAPLLAAVARSTPPRAAAFARKLVDHGASDVARRWLAEAGRADALADALTACGVDPALWAGALSDARRALACWHRAWREVARHGRDSALLPVRWRSALVGLVPLLVRVGGAGMPARAARVVLEVGDRFR